MPLTLTSFQRCSALLSNDVALSYSPKDYSTPSHWSTYKASELRALRLAILELLEKDPSLVQLSETTQTMDLPDQFGSTDLTSATNVGTFIPVAPLNTYVILLAQALDADLDFLQTLSEDQEVSLGILSSEHIDILNECAFRWRIPINFRAVVFVEAIVARRTNCLVPMESVMEALDMLTKVTKEIPVDQWAVSDVSHQCLPSGLCSTTAKSDDRGPSSLR